MARTRRINRADEANMDSEIDLDLLQAGIDPEDVMPTPTKRGRKIKRKKARFNQDAELAAMDDANDAQAQALLEEGRDLIPSDQDQYSMDQGDLESINESRKNIYKSGRRMQQLEAGNQLRQLPPEERDALLQQSQERLRKKYGVRRIPRS